MALNLVREGLDLPISGVPAQVISACEGITRVGVLAADYPGLQAKLLVRAGDRVRRGQALFEDRRLPGVRYCSPASGTIEAIHNDDAGTLRSLTITLSETEQNAVPDANDFQPFEHYTGRDLALLTRRDVQALLLESGLWTALRTRPFGLVASPEEEPKSIFVNAMNSHPLSPSMDVIAEGRDADLLAGMLAVAKLTNGYALFCRAAGSKISPSANAGFTLQEFQGPHPSGNVGLHLHRLEPVGRGRTSWYVGLPDLLAIGALFRTGRLDADRVIALAGPGVIQPRLLRTRLGAAIKEITCGALAPGTHRILSGSVLTGRAVRDGVEGFLGRFHHQVCALPETPAGHSPFCMLPIHPAGRNGKRFPFSAAQPRTPGHFFPTGTYERVMPFELPVTHLLHALIEGDYERAEMLGALELEEEDIALCSVVCTAGFDYASLLRTALTALERTARHG